jgi:hypothetical protein
MLLLFPLRPVLYTAFRNTEEYLILKGTIDCEIAT